jgi:hypothetical protein
VENQNSTFDREEQTQEAANFWLFRKVSTLGCKDGWESGELTQELVVAFWAGKKVFSF